MRLGIGLNIIHLAITELTYRELFRAVLSSPEHCLLMALDLVPRRTHNPKSRRVRLGHMISKYRIMHCPSKVIVKVQDIMLLCKTAIPSYALIRFCQFLFQFNSQRKNWEVNNAVQDQGLIIEDSSEAGLFNHWTKMTWKFFDLQLTEMCALCKVAWKRSQMQEAALLTTVYLCITLIDFHQLHWVFKLFQAPLSIIFVICPYVTCEIFVFLT